MIVSNYCTLIIMRLGSSSCERSCNHLSLNLANAVLFPSYYVGAYFHIYFGVFKVWSIIKTVPLMLLGRWKLR